MNESVGQAFQGGARAPPSSSEGTNVARMIANELDAAKFDPLLVRSVARSAKSSLDMLLGRTDSLVVRDRSAMLLTGPVATPQQVQNLSMATFLCHCGTRMRALEEEHSGDVYAILRPAVVVSAPYCADTDLPTNDRQAMMENYRRIVDPLLSAIKSDSGVIISKMHRDQGRSADPLAEMGGSSAYIKEITERLAFVKTEILAPLAIEEITQGWFVHARLICEV
jgi:conserved oligomeric Golgi complex subunit 5